MKKSLLKGIFSLVDLFLNKKWGEIWKKVKNNDEATQREIEQDEEELTSTCWRNESHKEQWKKLF